MNVQAENTTAIKTHLAAIMMVHLVAHVILALLEMELIVKVCLIGRSDNIILNILNNIYHEILSIRIAFVFHI